MRILVTGAAGFVGTYLRAHLRETLPHAQIVGLTQPGLPLPAPCPHTEFLPCDITRRPDLDAAVRDAPPDAVFHLAGAASGAADDREIVFAVNVDGTRFLLDAVHAHAPAARVLFASTGYVYGDCPCPARETDPLPEPAALGLYAESKRIAEDVARMSGVSVVTARAFNHTGPGQTTAFSVPAFASQIVQVERGELPCLSVGNLEALRDFCDVRDVVRAYALLLTQGVVGEMYNVCSGQAVSLRNVLDGLIALARVPVPVTQDPHRLRPSDVAANVGDASKLESLTGWQAHIPLVQTLSDTLNWWRKRPV